jgi:transposase-like protein
MSVASRRITFIDESKREAVVLPHQPGTPLSKVARDSGVVARILNRWLREFKPCMAKALAGSGVPGNQTMATLEREVVRVKKERDSTRCGNVLRQGIELKYQTIQGCCIDHLVPLMCRCMTVPA